MLIERHPENPIVRPGKYSWRAACVFNPGVILDREGDFWMLERAAGGLTPFTCDLGLLKSRDGVHFEHVSDEPVLTARQFGYPYGGLQDPRIVYMDGRFIMTYVLSRWRPNCIPTGTGLPRYVANEYPDRTPENAHLGAARSGIAVSEDMIHWEHLAYIGDAGLDDRDNILFPEKIGGQYAMLRRPMSYVGPEYGVEHPSIWFSMSDNLRTWDAPRLVAATQRDWEGRKIGGSTVPIRTEHGWLTTYHGVDPTGAYCLGIMLLDLEDPTNVIARTPEPVMRPKLYYEKFGLVIPNCVFPSATVVKDGTLHIYYGCCDTAIGLATCSLDALVQHVLGFRV